MCQQQVQHRATMLDAEGEPKTGLLRPLAALDLQRVFCP